jgi:hypothetical protein
MIFQGKFKMQRLHLLKAKMAKKMMYWACLAFVFCSFIFFIGCDKVKEQDVVGTWFLDEEPSVDVILFRRDGTFSLLDFPAIKEFGASERLQDITGDWHLESRNHIFCHFKHRDTDIFTGLEIEKTRSRIILYTIIGGPDSFERKTYSRRIDSTSSER